MLFLNAIILKQTKYSENDLIVSCLSHQQGLIQFIAYGAKKITSKKMPIIGLFRHLHLALSLPKTTDNNLYTLKKAELITSYDEIATSYQHFQSICYLSQFLIKNLHEDNQQNNLFPQLLLLLTAYIEKSSIPMWETIFLLNYLINYGYFHPNEESINNREFIKKIIKVEETFLELNQISDKVWNSLHRWLEQRCQFHDLTIPNKI